jgi:hypothetical protein
MRIGSNLCDSTRSFSSISGVEFLASHVFISWWSGIATPSINPTGPPDFMRAMIEYEGGDMRTPPRPLCEPPPPCN